MSAWRETPYQVGDAVYWVRERSTKRDRHLVPAEVVRAGAIRITIDTPTGRKVTRENLLVCRAYCAACGVIAPASLVCRECGQPATAEIPPPDLVVRWFGATSCGHPRHACFEHALAAAVATGTPESEARCAYHEWANAYEQSYREAQRAAREAEREAEWADPVKRREMLLSMREWLVDTLTWVDEELADSDGTGLHHGAIELPQAWAPPADDSEPDQADALTQWLAEQMRRRSE
jgi:hypothetical protein